MNWADTISLLTEAGYTQPQIAKLCGCSQSTISDIARGESKDPRTSITDVLRKLSADATRKLAKQRKVKPIQYTQQPAVKAALARGDDISIDNSSKG